MGGLRWRIVIMKMTSLLSSLPSSPFLSQHSSIQSNVLSLWAPEVLPQVLQIALRNPALQHPQGLGAWRPNDYHHPRNHAQLRRSRGRWMVLPCRISSPHPLHLLQEASGPNLHPILRRVRNQRPARPRAHVDVLELRSQLLQRIR